MAFTAGGSPACGQDARAPRFLHNDSVEEPPKTAKIRIGTADHGSSLQKMNTASLQARSVMTWERGHPARIFLHFHPIRIFHPVQVVHGFHCGRLARMRASCPHLPPLPSRPNLSSGLAWIIHASAYGRT